MDSKVLIAATIAIGAYAVYRLTEALPELPGESPQSRARFGISELYGDGCRIVGDASQADGLELAGRLPVLRQAVRDIVTARGIFVDSEAAAVGAMMRVHNLLEVAAMSCMLRFDPAVVASGSNAEGLSLGGFLDTFISPKDWEVILSHLSGLQKSYS